MEEKENVRKILIVTDGGASIQQTVDDIVTIIGNYAGYSVKSIQAEGFSAPDLLPAYGFFLGCESPKPTSFYYMESLFSHINLAGRPCGIFASTSKALKYLSVLVRDCESVVGKPFLVKSGAAENDKFRLWVQSILER